MDTKELRLNNLVFINNDLLVEIKANDIFRVSGINKRFELLFPESDSTVSLDHTNSIRVYNQFNQFIQPIPLTEEWLLKCGFKKNMFGVFLLDFSGYYLCKNDVGFFLVTDEVDDEFGFVPERPILLKIKFIHQLQNFYFALVGEEIKIQIT